MGCDIHLFVEYKNKDGKWAAVEAPPLVDKDDFDAWGRYRAYAEDGAPTYQWAFGRSYFSFALLADVRNDGNVKPLSAPRGIPSDVSDEVLAEYTLRVDDEKADEDGYTSAENAARWLERGYSKEIRPRIVTGPDWHSPSTFTLAELNAVDLSGVTIRVEGYVGSAQYEEYKSKGAPSSWCKSVGGGNVDHITNHEMQQHIAQGDASFYNALNRSVYTLISWQASGEDYARRVAALREELKALGAEHGDDNVRIVFWFDN